MATTCARAHKQSPTTHPTPQYSYKHRLLPTTYAQAATLGAVDLWETGLHGAHSKKRDVV